MTHEESRDVRACRDAVWGVLNESVEVARLVSGVESVEPRDEGCLANVKIPLGVGDLGLALAFEIVERRHPEFLRLVTTGSGSGLIFRVDSEIHLQQSDDASRTTVRWEGNVQLAGPSGSMGRRVVRPILAQQLSNVFDALEQRLALLSST